MNVGPRRQRQDQQCPTLSLMSKGNMSVDLPSHCKSMTGRCNLVQLSPTDLEFLTIMAEFKKSCARNVEKVKIHAKHLHNQLWSYKPKLTLLNQ